MFKRVIWMGAGFGAGVGATVWTEVKLRRTAQRLTPGAIGEEVAGRARAWRSDVLDALREGRQAMAEREAQLRAGTNPSLQAAPEPLALLSAPPSQGRPRSRHPRTPGPSLSPAVPWLDHGHERSPARFP